MADFTFYPPNRTHSFIRAPPPPHQKQWVGVRSDSDEEDGGEVAEHLGWDREDEWRVCEGDGHR